MYFSKNINYLRKLKGLSQIDLALAIGKKKGIIGAYENDRAYPDIPSLESLCKYFETDPTTLLLTDMSEKGRGTKVEFLGVAKNEEETGGVRIPLYGSVSAGSKGLAAFWEHEQPVGWVVAPEFAGCIAAFRVVGESMEPEVLNGDIVFIKSADSYFASQSIYLVVTGEERMIKRIKKQLDNPDILILSSPNYGEFSLPVSEVKQVYKVVGIMRVV